MKDLNADGIITCGGGTYDVVDLDGVVTITDNIICDTFNLDGVGKVKGSVQASSVKIAGTCKIEGDLKAEKVDLYGVLNLSGSLTGDHVEIDGALEVGEEVCADTFSLRMSHGSTAREICGQSCSIKKSGKGSAILGILRARKHEFVCESIECDDIYLEHCSVQHVNGQRVTIGPKCKIGNLEYVEEYSVHDSAKVEKISKRGDDV